MWELKLIRERRPSYGPAPQVRGSQDIHALLRDHFETLTREEFVVLPLNAKHRVIGFHRLSSGTITSTIVHPREVFALLFQVAATAWIAAHNHPSGDPEPSAEDLEITRRLRDVGELVGIRLLDHVVFGDDCYVSFADRGLF